MELHVLVELTLHYAHFLRPSSMLVARRNVLPEKLDDVVSCCAVGESNVSSRDQAAARAGASW